MVGTHKESNSRGSGSVFQSLVIGSNAEAGQANGVELGAESGSSESRCDGMLKYKRRRKSKVSENGKVSDDSVSQPREKNGSHAPKSVFDDCSLKHQRNSILENISRSLVGDGGLKSCIKNALVSHPENGSRTSVKESVYSCEEWRKCTSQTGTVCGPHKAEEDNLGMTSNGSVNEYKHRTITELCERTSQTGTVCGPHKAEEDNLGMTSNGSVNEYKHRTITELCERTFSEIIMSEKFMQLCSLLLVNFQGFKADKIFNLNHVNTRVKESVYESSPLLFQSDIQEIWTKLQNIGSDITALAKCLSEKTASSFSEQVGSSAHFIPMDSKYEFPTQESDMHAKTEQAEAHAPDGSHTCRHCRQKADVKNGLVCDSCEGMFHISCIDPPIKEIPTLSWYCANCTAKEIEFSHENCIACERLINTTSREEVPLPHKTVEELEESSNKLFFSEEGSEKINNSYCKVCRTEVKIGDEDYRICGHSFCPHKFYHDRCLTRNQLTSHGPCWYCPSCLCGGCLADRDDDKIVLCDGCDHAYHIYCMYPPRSDIPEGKWFCEKCESGLVRIREARRTYGIRMQGVSRKRGLDGRVKDKEGLDKSGGVDMLLNAAKTLNYEENLAFIGLNTI